MKIQDSLREAIGPKKYDSLLEVKKSQGKF